MSGAAAGEPEAMGLTKIAEGREAEIFQWAEHEVLRLYRDGTAGEGADREILALDSVRAALTSVPVQYGRMDFDGRPGIRMQRLEGHGVLTEIQRRPWRSWALIKLCGRVHAELNCVEAPESLPSLQSELRRRIESADGIPSGIRAVALEELARLPDGNALCHGDFHPDNVLLCLSGPAVIDWPDASRGDPCGDFARTALMMQFGSLAPGAPPLIRLGQGIGRGLFGRAYRAGYQAAGRFDDETLRRWSLVRAVDRLADDIAEERAPLLRAADRLARELGISLPAAV